MPKHQRDPIREQFWRQTIAEWRVSGRTIRDFCQSRQLKPTTFQHWRRELKRRDSDIARSVPPSTPPASKPPAFVPVTVVASTSLAPTLRETIEVRCPSGHVVIVPGHDGTTLRHLFAALATEVPSC